MEPVGIEEIALAKKGSGVEQLTLKGTEEEEILARLSEKVERAIVTIQELRRERDELRRRLEEAEGSLTHHQGTSEKLSQVEDEHQRFRAERDEIRRRIESILGNLESLDEPAREEQE